jgi:Na+-transporting NADH:ubiquinone oxidoreductase subunit C
VKKRLFSVAFMFVLTLFFTSMVSVVKLFTQVRVERNESAALQGVILEVLGIPGEGAAEALHPSRLFNERVKKIERSDRIVYAGYEADGRTVRGYAFSVRGPGFWGPIDAMVAVEPNALRILGIAFYRHSETPGLGARITENWFKKQFQGLPLYQPSGQETLFHLKPEGTGKKANELDAITGATQTSRAVEAFLNRELQRFLEEFPRLVADGGRRVN